MIACRSNLNIRMKNVFCHLLALVSMMCGGVNGAQLLLVSFLIKNLRKHCYCLLWPLSSCVCKEEKATSGFTLCLRMDEGTYSCPFLLH